MKSVKVGGVRLRGGPRQRRRWGTGTALRTSGPRVFWGMLVGGLNQMFA